MVGPPPEHQQLAAPRRVVRACERGRWLRRDPAERGRDLRGQRQERPGHRCPQNGWDTYTVGLCACDADDLHEADQIRWKKFYSNLTYLVATYDKPPNKPVAQAFSPTTDCYKACTGHAVVRTRQPTLKARVTDPYNGNLRTTFEVRAVAHPSGTFVTSTGTSPVVTASPGDASWRVNVQLAAGTTYYWRAYSLDENSLFGPWSDWQTITIDTTAPPAPEVSSTQYPSKTWGAQVGSPGTFALSATDAAEYTWSVDAGPTTTVAAGPVSHTPAKDMVHTLRAYATDVAGNKSPNTDHQFWVAPMANRCWNWRLNEAAGATTAADLGNTDAADAVCTPIGSTVQAQPGTVSGAVAFGPGHLGNAASVTGTGQIVTAGPVLDTTKSFTVMAWVRPS